MKPFEDFFRVWTKSGICTGTGAWEVAVRGSWIDLNDDDIRGGELTDVTLGVNWYMNAYAKMQFNYIHAFQRSPAFGSSNADVYAMRASLDF